MLPYIEPTRTFRTHCLEISERVILQNKVLLSTARTFKVCLSLFSSGLLPSERVTCILGSCRKKTSAISCGKCKGFQIIWQQKEYGSENQGRLEKTDLVLGVLKNKIWPLQSHKWCSLHMVQSLCHSPRATSKFSAQACELKTHKYFSRT